MRIPKELPCCDNAITKDMRIPKYLISGDIGHKKDYSTLIVLKYTPNKQKDRYTLFFTVVETHIIKSKDTLSKQERIKKYIKTKKRLIKKYKID